MRRLLITGGAGFIGSNFVRYWSREHAADRIVVLDALTYAGNPTSLLDLADDRRLRFVHGDIRDCALVENLLRQEQLDTIVHFAAESHVDRSIDGPDAFVETNIVGTHSLLKAARKVWLEEGTVPRHRFHHVSTDETYGSLGPDAPPFTESTPYAPNSPYSASKAASDHLVRAYHRTYGLNVSISNCSNNYGEYQYPEKLIPLTIVNLLLGRSVPVYGDGRNVRDWMHVHDHCRALDLILNHGQSGEIYNLGGGAEVENITLVNRLCDLLDAAWQPGYAERFENAPMTRGERASSLVTYVADRPGHDRRYAIDGRKAERMLGYRPQIGLDEGLASTMQWYLDNEVWWRSVLDGSCHRSSLPFVPAELPARLEESVRREA